MKAQHFARNILAAAVLSALGAHAAVAADFSEGVYENRGEQQEFENFTVKNADGGIWTTVPASSSVIWGQIKDL